MPNPEIIDIAKEGILIRLLSRYKRERTFAPSFTIVKDVVRAFDGITLIAAATVERTHFVHDLLFSTTDHNHLLANIVGGCVTFGVMSETTTYNIKKLKSLKSQTYNLAKALGAGMFGVSTSLTVLHAEQAHIITGSIRWLAVSGSLLIASRLIITPLIGKWSKSGAMAHRIAIVGVNDASERFIQKAANYPETCNIVAMYDDKQNTAHIQRNIKLRGNINQLYLDSQQKLFDSIIVTIPLIDREYLTTTYNKLLPIVANIQFAGDAIGVANNKQDFTNVGGNLVVTVYKKPLSEWQNVQKTTFDVCAALIIMLFMFPFLLVLAVAIKIDSRGPILFKQPRIGFNNLMFHTYKFRTMYKHMEDISANQQTTRDDPRITKLGKYLRKYSVDELPQLLNVLYGNMSLVGPRPHAPGTKADGKLFSDVVPEYAMRHRVKPGITGWAQINGWRGETKTFESIEKRVEYDLFYINNWSLWFDVKIMILTVLREIKSRNAF